MVGTTPRGTLEKGETGRCDKGEYQGAKNPKSESEVDVLRKRSLLSPIILWRMKGSGEAE